VAAENVNDELVLTDDILAQLTDRELTNVSLFDFPAQADSGTIDQRSPLTGCKTFPGDALWPLSPVWKVFNLLTGGALVKTVPIGEVCYVNSKRYDAGKCQDLLLHWNESPTQFV
jgi:hypothetical protein